MNLRDRISPSRVLWFARWAAVLWIVVFWRLGFASLLDPDEAHYAELTREMLRAHNWLVPLLDGVPFIDKPVLFHWLQGLSTLALGASEFALRLPSALAALALIFTTRWLGRTFFGETIGEWAALMLATAPATFALAHIGMTDMVYTAFLFGGVACLCISALRSRPPLQYAGYGLIALAVMTKGPVALVLVGLLFVAGLLAGGELRAAIRRLHWVRGATLICVISAPWFIWMWMTFGDRFIREYVVAGNIWYFTQPAAFSTRTTNYAFYPRIFFSALFPWSIVAAGALGDMVRRRRQEPIAPELLALWLWVLAVMGFFTLARFRLDHYIFPIAPACCLLSAHGWSRAAADRSWRLTRLAVALISVVLVAGAAVTSIVLFQINLQLNATALALPVALAVGGLALIVQLAKADRVLPRSATALVVALLAVYATVVLIGLPLLDRSRPTAAIAEWLVARDDGMDPVGIYGLDDWRASIRYYVDRPVVRLDGIPDVRLYLDTNPDGHVLMVDRDLQRVRGAGLRIRELASAPAIVGRTGRYFRSQLWGRLVIVAHPRHQMRDRRRRLPTS